MNLDLDGQVAMVTGGASGIGAAIVTALAREGCDVVIVDLRPDADGTREAVAALGRKTLPIQADVRDPDAAERAVARAIQEFGRLDVLVCNAGVTADATLRKMNDAQWDEVIDVNLKGAFHYLRAVAPRFSEQRRGKVVTIASINGLRGKFGQANYAASKGGLIALSKTAARELGPYNVNVNVVAPGMVMTDMAKRLPPEFVERAAGESVLGRVATPDDCADVVVFLCSDRARHITGEVVRVDGGQYI